MNNTESTPCAVVAEAVGVQAINETIHCQGSDLEGIRDRLQIMHDRLLGEQVVEKMPQEGQPARSGFIGAIQDSLDSNWHSIGRINSLLNELESRL